MAEVLLRAARPTMDIAVLNALSLAAWAVVALLLFVVARRR